jgi:hypothetical protein
MKTTVRINVVPMVKRMDDTMTNNVEDAWAVMLLQKFPVLAQPQ